MYTNNDETQSCYNANFGFTTTSTVILKCSHYNSALSSSNAACNNVQLHAEFANNVIIDCNRYSCYGARFYVNNVTNTVDIDFNYYGGYASTVYGYNILNNLNIYCKEYRACYSMSVYCPDDSSCNIYCDIS